MAGTSETSIAAAAGRGTAAARTPAHEAPERTPRDGKAERACRGKAAGGQPPAPCEARTAPEAGAAREAGDAPGVPRYFEVKLDPVVKRIVVEIMDRATGEVVQRIPPWYRGEDEERRRRDQERRRDRDGDGRPDEVAFGAPADKDSPWADARGARRPAATGRETR